MANTATVLREDIAAYEGRRAWLEAEHAGEWVVFHKGNFIGTYARFEDAAEEAADRFDRGPYLIRQIGVEEIQISPTMVFRPTHAQRSSGV